VSLILYVVLIGELIELIEASAHVDKAGVEAFGHAQLRIRVVVTLLTLTERQAHLYQLGFKSLSIFFVFRLCPIR